MNAEGGREARPADDSRAIRRVASASAAAGRGGRAGVCPPCPAGTWRAAVRNRTVFAVTRRQRLFPGPKDESVRSRRLPLQGRGCRCRLGGRTWRECGTMRDSSAANLLFLHALTGLHPGGGYCPRCRGPARPAGAAHAVADDPRLRTEGCPPRRVPKEVGRRGRGTPRGVRAATAIRDWRIPDRQGVELRRRARLHRRPPSRVPRAFAPRRVRLGDVSGGARSPRTRRETAGAWRERATPPHRQ